MRHPSPAHIIGFSVLVAALVLAACARSRETGAAIGGLVATPPATSGETSGGDIPTGQPATGGSTAAPATDAGRGRLAPSQYTATVDLKTVHFDYDRSDVRPQDLPVLDRNAGWMLEHPRYRILVEGHADERGTNEYNIALGEKRARTTMNYLVSKGVRRERLTVVSYGEERPLCTQSTDACWARNRRAAFLVKPD